MKLSCYELQKPVEITDEKISLLVIENNLFYRNFIVDLLSQSQNCSSRFTLFDDEILNFSKSVEMITDTFKLSFDSRFFQSKINQIVSEEINVSSINTAEILNKINEMGATLTSSLGFEANYVPVSDISGVVKLLNFYFDSDNLSFVEKIIEYLSFLNQYSEKKLFIILNLKSLLSKKEYDEFAKLIIYKKIKLLLIENHYSKDKSEFESVTIIDNDLCEI